MKTNIGQPAEPFEEKMWSLRPDHELKVLMREAIRATGTSRQQLIFQCIRQELPAVVRQMAEVREEALKGFVKKPK